MSKKILLSKRMFNHVTICRVFRRGVLCLACLLASQVVADFTDIDSLHLQYITDDVNIIGEYDDQILRILLGANQNQGITSSYNNDFSFNPIYKISNSSMINALNIIKQQMASPTYQNRVGNDYYATLYGLIAGWSPNSVPNVDGIPYGVETNGIFWYVRDFSDSLHNTNSVFHRQLTAQETLTNQMERFISLQAQNMTNLIYGISPLMTEQNNILPASFNSYRYMYYFPYGHTYSNNVLNSQRYSMLYNLGTELFLNNISMLPSGEMENDDFEFYFQLDGEGYLPQYLKDVSNAKYKYYGTKWGFDAITNILLSQDFDFNSISTVKPEVDDMIEDSTEEVQDSLPSAEESNEDGAAPGDYEEIQDERIDTSFLEEAKTDTTSIKFSEHLFDDFKSSYNGIFNFRSSSSLQYSFSLQSSDGVNVSVNDTDMLGNASQLLSEKKPTIDAFIKIIIGLNKFICLVVFVGKAFKMVSEIFSS